MILISESNQALLIVVLEMTKKKCHMHFNKKSYLMPDCLLLNYIIMIELRLEFRELEFGIQTGYFPEFMS